mgnify:CR=1 FL=1
MARRGKEGEVIVREWKRGTGFALRFRAYGERRYLTLGYEGEGDPPLDFDRADEELDNILADVRRGIWVPPPKKRRGMASSSGGDDDQSELVFFGPFAGDLVASREGQVSDNHLAYLEWGLRHLNPYFAERALIEFDAELVDAYRLHKVKEAAALAEAIDRGRPRRDAEGRIRRPLSAVSINKTIDVLQWVLGVAVEYKKRTGLTENPAVGTKRRLVEPDRRPVHLDSAEQIEALLLAAAELDRDPRCHCDEREAIVATLVFAGPRAHELGHLLWRDVDLANGRIFVGRSKTRAGLREIPLLPILRDILAAHKARAYRAGPDDLVFPTGTGGRRDKDNLRERVLELLFERADELLIDRGRVPLPIGLTAHKLRHTFASVLIAIGEDPVSVKEALGHTTPGFTLSVYTHMMKRDKAAKDTGGWQYGAFDPAGKAWVRRERSRRTRLPGLDGRPTEIRPWPSRLSGRPGLGSYGAAAIEHETAPRGRTETRPRVAVWSGSGVPTVLRPRVPSCAPPRSMRGRLRGRPPRVLPPPPALRARTPPTGTHSAG